jgi:hypothetical protein
VRVIQACGGAHQYPGEETHGSLAGRRRQEGEAALKNQLEDARPEPKLSVFEESHKSEGQYHGPVTMFSLYRT